MSNIKNLDEKSFNEFVRKGMAVVDFWAGWCGPCKIVAPIFEEVSKEMKGKIKFGKIDVDKETELAQKFEVMSIPTMIFFKDGEQVDRAIGVLSKEELNEKLESI
ncbi:thioredoxin [Candidatus Pacearchaeota archaeon]|nr:thioredoxin [Candidatus Pacearchaeota archaeon]